MYFSLGIHARYSSILESLLQSLHAVEVLRKDYESDYSGYVDVDVLLKDGRIFSYRYSYGSCSGCDEWEQRELTDTQIRHEMHRDATFFETRASYDLWREYVKEQNKN